ncbi:MAG: ABC transporter substrate-binding protein [Candidatus Bathyarchaeota archaeon]|nr:ABC transporter substrate-binding protein [Candidatus Bathyarchaeota archaeon]
MNKNKIIAIIIIAAIAVVGIYGAITLLQPAEEEPEAPITITDGAGYTVTFDEYPENIVSIAPSCTEILFAIGLEDKTVGAPIYDKYSPEIQAALDSGATESVGDFQTINAELVVGLEPDLILAKSTQMQAAEQFKELGKKVVILTHEGFSGYLSDIELIGQITGADEDAATFVADIESQAQEIADATKDLEKPTVYVEYGNFGSYGAGSVVNELITMAGGVNIFADADGQYITASTEDVLDADPDIIIISAGVMSEYFGCTPEEIATREGWSALSAVINEQIYEVDENLITVAGPDIVEGIQTLAEIFHPEVFGTD